MYAWIWRLLPFGLRGKIAGSVLLAAGVGSLLWFVVFPVAEPKMPFNNVQMPGASESPSQGPGPASPSAPPGASPSVGGLTPPTAGPASSPSPSQVSQSTRR